MGNQTVHEFGSATHETNRKLFPVKSRREFAIWFHDSICFVVSCVTEVKPMHSLVPHMILKCQLHPWLLQERLQGRVWEPKFLDFLPEVPSLGDRSSRSTVILTNYYRHFNPDSNSINSAASLKTQIRLPFHLIIRRLIFLLLLSCIIIYYYYYEIWPG